MLYYIYYGYMGGYIVYRIYEYSHMLRYGYNTLYYTYSLTQGIYSMLTHVKDEKESESLEQWEYIEKNENFI